MKPLNDKEERTAGVAVAEGAAAGRREAEVGEAGCGAGEAGRSEAKIGEVAQIGEAGCGAGEAGRSEAKVGKVAPVGQKAHRRLRRGEVVPGTAWALVSGAGSGIGRCYARQLAALGYNLVLVGNNRQPLETVRAEIAEECPTCDIRIITCDLARVEAAREVFDRTQADGLAIDVLINNAGMFSFRDILQTPKERIERIILLHDLTNTQLCRLYATDMARRGHGGYILNMSSYSQWMPFPGLALYAASKAYLRTFSVAFAKEVREVGIRVTSVSPAGVATDLYGLTPRWQRIGLHLGVLISADHCARKGLRALWRGRRSIVPDWWNRAWIPLCKILPMWILRPIRRFTMQFQK